MRTCAEAAGRTSYPGRGIILGVSADGKSAVCAYFIMGRSVNSRNRVFVADGDGIRTEARDPAKLADPSLVIYAPVRVVHDATIVTNGDQTDTVATFLRRGDTFEDALRTRTFEPDAPHYTPRVSGIMERANGACTYKLSILKSADGEPASCRRFFFEYAAPLAGQGHFIHTYAGDGNPLPSFVGEPEPVSIEGGIDAFSETLWNALDADNKVSLFVRFIDLASGAAETRIVNKY